MKCTVIENRTANINKKNCSLSIVLTATDQKLPTHKKGDIGQHYVDIQTVCQLFGPHELFCIVSWDGECCNLVVVFDMLDCDDLVGRRPRPSMMEFRTLLTVQLLCIYMLLGVTRPATADHRRRPCTHAFTHQIATR